jgi:hypothetical protein
MIRQPQDHTTERRALLLIPLAALMAVLPLIVHGCSCGHDFDFHLISWMEVATQFSHGNLHPHWAYTPAYNAGEPRFVFYPPLSWMLGGLLGLVLTHIPRVTEAAGWNAVPVLYTWIALTLSGLSLRRLAREFAGENAALLAAILYLVNPYMLFTAYERTAYAELLATAWIPLLLLALLREKVTIPGIAIPLALLWLTNAPAAIIGSYSLALLAAVRLVTELRASRKRSALQLAVEGAAGTALGLALAAFYIVPAAYERRFVRVVLATLGGMSIDQNFLFEHTGISADAVAHDAVLHTASLIAVILLIATAAALVVNLTRRKTVAPASDLHTGESRTYVPLPAIPLIILTAGIALLLTPLSVPIWRHIPEVALLQFPWRMLAILAAVFAVAVAAAISRIRLKFATTAAVATVLAASLALPAYHWFHQRCYPEDTPTARLAVFHSPSGTDPTDEYTPTVADNDALTPNAPPYWLASSAKSAAPTASMPGAAPMHLTVTAAQSEFLVLNLRDYPTWRLFLNGKLDPKRESRDDGLIAVSIPSGDSTIDIRYARSPDRIVGDIITLLALLVLLWLLTMREAPSAEKIVSV